eukprot:14607674-Alexandrium_andersonii.AAC.1
MAPSARRRGASSRCASRASGAARPRPEAGPGRAARAAGGRLRESEAAPSASVSASSCGRAGALPGWPAQSSSTRSS